MFVRKSKYEKLKSELNRMENVASAYQKMYRELRYEWNDLVGRVNAAGGIGAIKESKFDEDDIKRLLNLCHPDKHGGKPMAVDMTQKLLKMRGK